MKLQSVLVESILLKILALIMLRKTGPFLSVVMIIFWTVSNSIPGVVFTILGGIFFGMCHDGTFDKTKECF